MEDLPKPFGRYVLLNKLAMGGMAEIYKAKTYGVDGFEKQLAIKRILTNYSADKEFIHMLIDEAKLTVLLSHANIVQVFDLGKVGEDYFISMEYINGTNLRELVTRFGSTGEKFPEDIAVYIISEVCKGLDYAHRKTDSEGGHLHIVHRDISPQNILISYEGEVKIVDFGIAKAAMNVSHTSAGILKGKISYMSPEQALGKPIDHRTDIFSAGLVLYEMLTGQKLFVGDTQFEVLNLIRTKKITKEGLPETISPGLRTLLAKALHFSTRERYQSAGDFQLDLTKYLYSSYIDFSPRQLSALLIRLFETEIKKKDPSFSISEKTKSVLIRQSKMEDIVVHGPPSRSITDMEAGPDTSASGFFEETKASRSLTPFLWLGGGILLVLLGIFAFLLWRSPSRQDQVSPPAVTRQPTEEVEEFGSLQIKTTPAGARIFINDENTGLVTPARVGQLSLGEEYQIRLEKENYRDFFKTVALTTAEPVVIEVPLMEKTPPPAAEPIPPPSVPQPTPQQPASTTAPTPPLAGQPSPPPITAPAPPEPPVTAPPSPPLAPPEVTTSSPPPPAGPTPTPPPPSTTPPPVVTAPVKPPEVKQPEAKPTQGLKKPEGKLPEVKKPTEKEKKKVEKKPEEPSRTGPVVTKPVEPPPKPVERPVEKPVEKVVTGKPLGEIQIGSRPSRALIYLDGNSLGIKTPVTIGNIPRNRSHRVKLVLEGYKTWEGTVDLSSDDKKSINVRLEKE